jgi:acetylornithine deacetylase/succinyl-diaminopimelate desuccinylase-like protein
MGSVIHHISRLRVSTHPKTTYNIGLVEGGDSVNTIAPQAKLVLDLRSLQPAALRRLEARVGRILQKVEQETRIHITSRLVGQRPAAELDVHHPLAQGIQDIRKRLHLRPALFGASSTDANLPLSLDIPAVCLGITRGGLAHTVKEYIDVTPILAGIKQLYLTIRYTLEQKEWRIAKTAW